MRQHDRSYDVYNPIANVIGSLGGLAFSVWCHNRLLKYDNDRTRILRRASAKSPNWDLELQIGVHDETDPQGTSLIFMAKPISLLPSRTLSSRLLVPVSLGKPSKLTRTPSSNIVRGKWQPRKVRPLALKSPPPSSRTGA